MVLFLVAVVLGTLDPSSDDPSNCEPVVTGISPPGITLGTRQTWTITGRNLQRVASVVATGDGLILQPPSTIRDGCSLTVEVAASPDATPGYREIRVDGPSGISNLAVIRVDSLPQVVEIEPNDRTPAPSQVILVGEAVAGTIRALDVDHYRVEGKPGQSVTLDWEVRRLGTAIIPVMTITGPDRRSIGQVRSWPGGDRDCRTSLVVPADGWFEVELRDNTFGGDPRARYRLRVDPAPFASAIEPLGMPRATLVASSLIGGSLRKPLAMLGSTRQPGGSWFIPDPSPADLNGFSVLAPGRVRVDDPGRPTVARPKDHPAGQPWPVEVGPAGVTINGRLTPPGQVDRYRVLVQRGDRFRARVEAAPAGSWLDSVLTILGPRGDRLGENDDRSPTSILEPPTTIDGSPSTDSEVDVEIKEDGPITVELADRADRGGPEYGYRLELGPPRTDFAIYLVGNPNSTDLAAEARSVAAAGPSNLATPGAFGVYNLRPGSSTAVPFLIVPRGRPGTVEVRVEGLPPGVEADSVTVRLAPPPRPGSKAASQWDAPPVLDSLRLRVRADAQPVLGQFQVMARARKQDDTTYERDAVRVIGVDSAGGPDRPVIRQVTTLPTRVLADLSP